MTAGWLAPPGFFGNGYRYFCFCGFGEVAAAKILLGFAVSLVGGGLLAAVGAIIGVLTLSKIVTPAGGALIGFIGGFLLGMYGGLRLVAGGNCPCPASRMAWCICVYFTAWVVPSVVPLPKIPCPTACGNIPTCIC